MSEYCEGCGWYDHCTCSEYEDEADYDYNPWDDTYPCGCCTCCGCFCWMLEDDEDEDE